MRILFFALLFGSIASPLRAADADPQTGDELNRIFRTVLAAAMPDPLVKKDYNWGHQEMATVGVRWEKKGILLKPVAMKKMTNEGLWRTVTVTADDPAKKLVVEIKDVKIPETGRMTFAATMSLPVHVKYEQQLWKSGVRLYSGETRARCRMALALNCESLSRFEKKPDSILPELVMRMRVVDAKLTYHDLVIEHTLGVGGDAAKLLGEGVLETVKWVKPTLEKDLLDKANAAIVKAGDTKEVRLGLSKLLP